MVRMKSGISEKISFTGEESEIFLEINKNVFVLCERLPPVLQGRAALFINAYGQNSFRFFEDFPVVLWALLISLGIPVDPQKKRDILAAHAMALFLHSFDDHLHDGQLAISHLLLQLRTEAWQWMQEAWGRLGSGKEYLVENGIERYFQALMAEEETTKLLSFFANTKEQSATWQITPLLAAHTEPERKSAAAVIENFVVAYRILDDLEDFEKDLLLGEKKSVYYTLDRREREIYASFYGVSRGEKERDKWVSGYYQDKTNFYRLLQIAQEYKERAIWEAQEARWSRLAEWIEFSFQRLCDRVPGLYR